MYFTVKLKKLKNVMWSVNMFDCAIVSYKFKQLYNKDTNFKKDTQSLKISFVLYYYAKTSPVEQLSFTIRCILFFQKA